MSQFLYKKINRRKALQLTSGLVGGAILTSYYGLLLQSCGRKLNWQPKHLNSNQAEILTDIIDVILPKTDTPGAVEAMVPQFAEEYIFNVLDTKDKENFVENLSDFDDVIKEKKGKKFSNMDISEKRILLKEFHKTYNEKKEQSKNEENISIESFYVELKRLTFKGFFKSEIGATQVLQYDPIPEKYIGCVPLAEVGKTWAT